MIAGIIADDMEKERVKKLNETVESVKFELKSQMSLKKVFNPIDQLANAFRLM